MRALEDNDVDLADVVEKKRERAEKRRMKLLNAANGSNDVSEMGTPEPSGKKGKKGKASSAQTPELSPGPGGKKRKRFGNFAGSPSPDDDASQLSRSASFKKPRKNGQPDERDRMQEILSQCYKAADSSTEVGEDGSRRKRNALFLDIPKKSDYPDYHVIIQKPISLRQIRRRIDNRTYRTVTACREDVELMVNNAKTYNQEGSWVYNDAVEIWNAFEAKYDEVARFSGLPGSENEGAVGMNGDAEEEEDDDDDAGRMLGSNAQAPAASTPQAAGTRPKIRLSMKGRGNRASMTRRVDSDDAMDDE